MLRFLSAAMAAALIAGCGNQPSEKDAPLTFQKLDDRDTTGLSSGRTLLHEFEVARDPAGALRARGRTDLPEGMRLELIVYSVTDAQVLARTQFAVRDHRFETAPILGAGGRLPEAVYHFQLRGLFDSGLQPAEVMAATGNGLALRGPGMVRGPHGTAFVHDAKLRR